MTHPERFEVALTRVRAGESISSIVASLYTTWRRYKQLCSESERHQITSARLEYKAAKALSQAPPKTLYRRFIANTTSELHQAVTDHCKANNLDVGRFLNTAVRESLKKAKNQ